MQILKRELPAKKIAGGFFYFMLTF